MKVWVTTYALTQGIHEVEGEIDGVHGGMFFVDDKTGFRSTYYHKPNWHLTKEEAIARAEVMRVKKIASLRKSLSNLEKLSWS